MFTFDSVRTAQSNKLRLCHLTIQFSYCFTLIVVMGVQVIFQCHWTLEVPFAIVAVKLVLVLVALDMLVEKILASKGTIATTTWKFIWICMQNTVTGQIIKTRVLSRAVSAGKFVTIRVTALMIAQITFLGKDLITNATNQLLLFVVVLVRGVDVIVEIIFCLELALAIRTVVTIWRIITGLLFFQDHSIKKILVRHYAIEIGVLKFRTIVVDFGERRASWRKIEDIVVDIIIFFYAAVSKLHTLGI